MGLLLSVALHTCAPHTPELRAALAHGPLVCKCRAVVDMGQEMVACRGCKRLHHCDCVGVGHAGGGGLLPKSAFRCFACSA